MTHPGGVLGTQVSIYSGPFASGVLVAATEFAYRLSY